MVRKLTGGFGADVACDFVGFPQVIPEGIEMLGPGGTYLEIGTISRGAKIELEPAQLVWGAKKIVGVIMYDPWVIPRALDFLVRNRTRFAFDKLISQHVSAREDQRRVRAVRVARARRRRPSRARRWRP